MCPIRKSVLLVSLIAFFLQADCADKYTDENRPYEFGFNIEGEQHRHEKKDENGIIMGEFGFITADGVYHVTVYATDENGNFKILSMKNIRVKPYPTAPTKKGHSLPFPPSGSQPPPPPPPVAAPAKPFAASPARTCSSCSIPTTTTKAPQLTDIASVSNVGQYPDYNTVSQPQSQNYPQQQNQPQNYPQGQIYPQQQNQPQSYPQGQNYPGQQNQPQSYPQGQNYPEQQNQPQNYQQEQNYLQQSGGLSNNLPQNNLQTQFGGSTTNLANRGGFDDGQNYPGVSPSLPSQYGGQFSGERSPKQFKESNYPSGGLSADQNPNAVTNSKPMLISAQMQIVDKNTDIYKLKAGEKEGLPAGLNKEDMQQLLYTFNYTVGFHGHHEEGYRNGAKKGYYYVTGRNGVRTRVDYEADEKGFRPKITEEVLDLLSEDVPKPETEKDEKYGLKGYEFKWLYFPTAQK